MQHSWQTSDPQWAPGEPTVVVVVLFEGEAQGKERSRGPTGYNSSSLQRAQLVQKLPS